MGLVLNCSRCGGALPPLSEDDEKLLRAGKPFVAQHDVCPDQRAAAAAAAPKTRRFEARVKIVEIIEREPVEQPTGLFVPGMAVQPPPTSVPADPEVVELAGFVAWVDATSFSDGVRPLALALGERWMEVEKHAPLADTPDLVNIPDSETSGG